MDYLRTPEVSQLRLPARETVSLWDKMTVASLFLLLFMARRKFGGKPCRPPHQAR